MAGVSAFAQQQTGAPAGIPVPPAPSTGAASDTGSTSPGELHFRVRVVDGRNGAPIQNAHVRLWYDEPAGLGYEFATNAHGVANMPAPAGDPVRVLVAVTGYADCRKPLRSDPQTGYSLRVIARSGVLAENSCGQVAVRPQPGELVLFARPQHWYEGLNRETGN